MLLLHREELVAAATMALLQHVSCVPIFGVKSDRCACMLFRLIIITSLPECGIPSHIRKILRTTLGLTQNLALKPVRLTLGTPDVRRRVRIDQACEA